MKFLSRLFGRKGDNKNIISDDFRQNSNAINYVNSQKFSSATNYLIWVDLKNFKVNILKGSTGKWNLVHSYLCTIGKPATPTPKGNFTVGIKGLYAGIIHNLKETIYFIQ